MSTHDDMREVDPNVPRKSGIGHRCVNQDLPYAHGGRDCTCPPPEPLTVWVVVDSVPYEGDHIKDVFASEKDAWGVVVAGAYEFTGIPGVLPYRVQGEPE